MPRGYLDVSDTVFLDFLRYLQGARLPSDGVHAEGLPADARLVAVHCMASKGVIRLWISSEQYLPNQLISLPQMPSLDEAEKGDL